MQPFSAGLVTGGFFAFDTQTEDSSTYRKPVRATSARRSRACRPCAWFCGHDLHVPDCTLQQSLDTHAEGFYSADIVMTTNATSDSALHALSLRSWPAVGLSASTSQSAATLQLISQHLPKSAALPYCNTDPLFNAFQCIARPNTTFA